MLTGTEKVLFALLAIFSAYGTYLGFSAVLRTIQRGRSPELQFNWRRILRAGLTWITMRPIWGARPITSTVHAALVWGFVFYLAVNVVDLIRGYWSGPYPELPGATAHGFRLCADLFSGIVLVAMAYLLIRRFLLPDGRRLQQRSDILRIPAARVNVLRLTVDKDSLIVGAFILCHVGFRVLGESVQIQAAAPDAWQPLATGVSALWAGFSTQTLTILHHACWWIALGLIAAFMPYFPYTKHFHFIMAGFNFATKPVRRSMGALDPLDFQREDLDTFGVLRIEELPQTGIADAFACIMCNRCQDVCPAYDTGKDLSPAALEINKRYFLNERLSAMANGAPSDATLLDFAITESAVWACTACGACIEACPVGNEPMLDILDLRRGLVLMEDRYPDELESAWRGMERNGNPWNMSAADRMNWAEGLSVPTIEEQPDAELLWWVGCAPSYDARAQRTARALARILHASGKSFAVLGGRERCTGDSARRSGNEYLFDQLARHNIETLRQAAPKRIVTTCPHCMHTLANEYPALGGTFEVIHHTQLLSELAAQGRLPKGTGIDTVTYHDPCYLGRQNGITEEPRLVLDALGLSSTEMPRNRARSYCCGAGGAQMWKEEEAPPVNAARYQEAEATGARTLAVSCPFCLTMMRDAATDGPMTVKDVAELAAEGLDACAAEE